MTIQPTSKMDSATGFNEEKVSAPIIHSHGASPKWTLSKNLVIWISAGLFLLLVLTRFWVLLAGEESTLPRLLGLIWVNTSKILSGTQVIYGEWSWPALEFYGESTYAISLGWNVILDMLAGVCFALFATELHDQTSFRRVSRHRALWRTARLICFTAVMVYTYHWCNIDPFGVWKSRGNAWTHLAGRTFSETELASIKADSERAPTYYAEGEANYIVSEKYRTQGGDLTSGVFEKQKEVRAKKEELLAQMDEATRASIIKNEYDRLLVKKRGGYWPPELSPRSLWMYSSALLETIAIAIWASLLAVLCAIPLSLLAARNTLALIAPGDGTGHRAIRWVAIFLVRRSLDSCRGFNELVMALIFVSIIGLGPFAGILALFVHTTGILGKVFSEAIEAIDPGQVEALVGTGAGSAQAISFSVMPQVMPMLIGFSLYRFEANVRSAAILGWVGAGGIGFLLQDKMVGYSHREVCTMMIMVIVSVSLIDYFCGKLRRRFI